MHNTLALFFIDQQQFDDCFPLIWFGYNFFGNFLQYLASFFAGSIPWFHHLLRRYLHLPWHVFRSLRFLEAYSFGSRCICSLVILVGMGCYHLFRYVFPSISWNKCQIGRHLNETWPFSTNKVNSVQEAYFHMIAISRDCCDWLKDEK